MGDRKPREITADLVNDLVTTAEALLHPHFEDLDLVVYELVLLNLLANVVAGYEDDAVMTAEDFMENATKHVIKLVRDEESRQDPRRRM